MEEGEGGRGTEGGNVGRLELYSRCRECHSKTYCSDLN